MIYICDAQGNAVGCIPEHVVQGSKEAGVLTVAAPVAESAQLSVTYRLPSGKVSGRQVLSCVGLLEGVQGEGGIPLYGWQGTIPASVTAHYGTVAAQFSFAAADGTTQAGIPVLFTVERGVVAELPQQPDGDIYGQILAAIAQVKADVVAANFAARSLYAYHEGTVYAADEIVYCPEAAVYGTFVRSLVSDNSTPPYAEDGTLNGSAWAEVCTFQDVYTQASAAKESAEQAKISEDAAAVWEQRASLFSESSETQANIASEAASSALHSQIEAVTSEQNAAESAKAAAESAEAAKKAANAALSYNYQYESYEALPRPGSTRFIYMVPSGSGEAGDEYAEYAWSEQKNNYERIGSALTREDFAEFVTKDFANSIVCIDAPVQTEAEPAVGAEFAVATASFARTPQTGDCFSALCKNVQTEKLYYVCAKILSVSDSEAQAQILSLIGMSEEDVAEIVLTDEEIRQYESSQYHDAEITLSAAVDMTKKFAALNLGKDGRVVMARTQDGYMASFVIGEGSFVYLAVNGESLYIRFLFGLVSPRASDAGKILVVNDTGDGYQLVSSVAHAEEAAHAQTADSAATAADAEQLGGVAASGYALSSQLPAANPAEAGTEALSSLKIGDTVYTISGGSGGSGGTTVDLGEFDSSVNTSQNGGFTTTVTVDAELQNKLLSAQHVSFTVITSSDGKTSKQKYTIPIANSAEVTGSSEAVSAMGLVEVSGDDDDKPYNHIYTICRFSPSNSDGTEYGLTVYDVESDPRIELPYPYSWDAGKVPAVKEDGTGYELLAGGARLYRHSMYIPEVDRYLVLISKNSGSIIFLSDLKEDDIVVVRTITETGQRTALAAVNCCIGETQIDVYYIKDGNIEVVSLLPTMMVADSSVSV